MLEALKFTRALKTKNPYEAKKLLTGFEKKHPTTLAVLQMIAHGNPNFKF